MEYSINNRTIFRDPINISNDSSEIIPSDTNRAILNSNNEDEQ